MSYISVQNVWKTYGHQVVLEGVKKDVEEGEFVTIVGASGCGKSTFLKLLLGTESASRGQILLDGQPLVDEPSADRGIVFQRYSVFPHLTVVENVMLAKEFVGSRLLGKLFGHRAKKVKEEAAALVESVGLGHALNKYPHELSGGMQQRLALAQSLIQRPRILLLDEPFGALDPGIRADMHEIVRSLWSEQSLTIFMVTHDIQEAFYLGSRLWVFDKLRHDPHSPEAYGAQVTYDLDIRHETSSMNEALYESMSPSILDDTVAVDI